MAPGSQVLDNVIKPDAADQGGNEQLRDQLDQAFAEGYRPVLIGPDGAHVELSDSAFRALSVVVRGMAAGMTMTLMPSGKQLTTKQAAEMLGVSRPHLIKLLDEGVMPFERVGTHRRLRAEDVLAYRADRNRRRREQLDALSQLAQDQEGQYR